MNNNQIKSNRRNFNLMVVGQIISILGSALLRFGLSLYVLDITGSAGAYAAIFAISNIPLLLSPIGGAIADRFHRRNLMVIFDFASSAVVFIFILLWAFGNANVMVIGTVMVLLSIISAMYQPTVNASIPSLVSAEKLEQANGIVNGIGALSNMAAPVLGGIIYGIAGFQTLIIASCIAFFLSAVMEIFIQIPFVKRAQKGHIVPTIAKDMKDGFRYVIKQSYIFKSMVLAAMLNLILTPFLIVGVPIILRVTMGSSDTMYGIGMGIIQFSTILGALTTGFFAKKMKLNTLYKGMVFIGILIIPMALAISPMMSGTGYYPSFLLFFGCAVPIAMAMTIVSIYVLTMVQKQTPDHMLGKVMAIIMAVSQCAAPIGQVIYGILFEAFSLRAYLPAVFLCVAMAGMSVFAKIILKGEGGAEYVS